MPTLSKLSDLTPDKKNANKGRKRGQDLVAKSLEQCGAGRSILADKNGRVIAGNKTLEAAFDQGLKAKFVETSGDELVVVIRKDLDLQEDSRARELAYYDNRANEVGLEWDKDQVAADLAAGVALDKFFFGDELATLVGQDELEVPDNTEAPKDQAVRLVMTDSQFATYTFYLSGLMDRFKTKTATETVLKAMATAGE